MADAPDPADKTSLPAGYVPPKVWTWDKASGGHFASINRPIAGATHDKELPVGKHPLQLYSLGTPNGLKVTIMLEELLAAGHAGAEYDAWLIKIGEGDQFGSRLRRGQSELQDPGAARPHRSRASRSACSNSARSWSIWPRSSAPSCPPIRRPHRDDELAVLADGLGALPRRRFRPFLRLCAGQDRICDRPLCDGNEAPARRARPPSGRAPISWPATISIADMAIWPWYGEVALGQAYGDAATFLSP